MAITTVSTAGHLVLSENPAEFHLQTDAWVTQQPVAGVYELAFTTKLSTGLSYLTLTWGGQSVTFIVVPYAVAYATGYALPDDLPSTTLVQYVQALANTWFAANYYLEKDFIIEYAAGPLVRFTAKEPGTELEMTWTTDIPSGEAVMSEATSAVAWEYAEDHSFILDIEVEEVLGSGEYTRVGTVHADPVLYDDSGTWIGEAKIDVAKLLSGFLQNRIDLPTIGSGSPQQVVNTLLLWRAIYAEQFNFNGDVVATWRTQSSDYQVLKGGLKHLDVPLFSDLLTDFYGATDKPWNTWQPNGKEVTMEEQHWLTLYCDTDYPSGLRLQAKVYYSDGTTSATTTLTTNGSHGQYEAWIYRVGFNDEGLDALTPSGVVPTKYDVWMIDTGSSDTVGVLRTFKIVDSTRNDRFFLFENSLGAFDTLRCNGERTVRNSVEKTEAKRVVQAGYAADEHILVQQTIADQDSFEIFTGWKPRAEVIHLRDFMRSSRVFELLNGALIPIVVEPGTFDLEYDRTGSYNYGLKFGYRYAFTNTGYSNA